MDIPVFGKKISNLYIVFLLFLLILAYANFKYDRLGDSIPFQLIAISIIFYWLILNNNSHFFSFNKFQLDRTIHPLWAVVVIAIFIRVVALTIFPLDIQPGFEEIQTGEVAKSIMLLREIPIEFRFTNIIGAFGFLFGGKMDLTLLRLPFRIVGLFVLFLLGAYFKNNKTNWRVVLVILFFAATNKFFVLSGAIADELFAAIPFLIIFLFSLSKLDTRNTDPVLWAGLAGFFAGILFFEYISYRIPVFVMSIWLVFFYNRSLKIGERLHILFSFFLCLLLVSIPTILQTLKYPESSIFFDGLRRHFGERSTFISQNFFSNLKDNFFAIFGYPSNISAMFTPHQIPMITPIFGWLFLISMAYCLIFEKKGFRKFLALSVLVTIVVISIFSNNNNIGRASPILWILLMISGCFLDRVVLFINPFLVQIIGKPKVAGTQESGLQAESAAKNKFLNLLDYGKKRVNLIKTKDGAFILNQSIIEIALKACYVFILFAITTTNFIELTRMVYAPEVLREYANNEYALCSFLGRSRYSGQMVYYFSTSEYINCPGSLASSWYFSDEQFEIIGNPISMLEKVDFKKGSLILVGDPNKLLEQEDLEKLLRIGNQEDALKTLMTTKDITGKLIAASICYQCE
ncbi:MAG: hypothetical protein CVU39_21095 [Chloroflexi bacterium HGW-Chloroflexi-10]|nr:MAG: hypothetical protein CVU39_21095 [Chloroflexi bacterium HGW-Chloroflexi-10]